MKTLLMIITLTFSLCHANDIEDLQRSVGDLWDETNTRNIKSTCDQDAIPKEKQNFCMRAVSDAKVQALPFASVIRAACKSFSKPGQIAKCYENSVVRIGGRFNDMFDNCVGKKGDAKKKCFEEAFLKDEDLVKKRNNPSPRQKFQEATLKTDATT